LRSASLRGSSRIGYRLDGTMDAAAWTISVIAIVIVMLIALREFGRR
jgi:hypothetical protein